MHLTNRQFYDPLRDPQLSPALSQLSPNTVDSYVPRIRRFVMEMGLKDKYTIADINIYLKACESSLYSDEKRSGYIRNALIAIQYFLKKTGRADDQTISYISELIQRYGKKYSEHLERVYLNPRLTGELVYSNDEAEALLKAAMRLDERLVEVKRFGKEVMVRDHELRGWVRTVLIGMSMETGLRPIELRNIVIENLVIDNNRVHVTVTAAKGGKTIVKIISRPEVVEAIRKRLGWLMGRKGTTAKTRFVLGSKVHIYRLLSEIVREARLMNKGYYGFRRAEVIKLVSAGEHPVVIAEWMGWRNVNMVSYYHKVDKYEVAERVLRTKRQPDKKRKNLATVI